MGEKTVLFDFDGTIADTMDVTFHGINHLAQLHGFKAIEGIDEIREKDIRSFASDVGLSIFRLAWLVRKLRLILFDKKSEITIFDGIKPLCEQCVDHGIKVGIITSNSSELVVDVIGRTGLRSLVEHVFGGSAAFGKARIINRFLKEQNLEKGDVVYIGDELRDIEACKKARIRCISACWGFSSRNFLAKYNPDFLVDNPQEVFPIVKRLL